MGRDRMRREGTNHRVRGWGGGEACLPNSILFNIALEHFKNDSSTFSPVNALVSRNISSLRNLTNNK